MEMTKADRMAFARGKWLFSLILILLLPGPFVGAQGQFLTIDSAAIWTVAIGLADREPGEPLLVLESGLGTPLDHWDRILESAAQLAPVVAYDRPGIGRSEPDAELPTPRKVADKLLRLLERLGQAPPYLLVGHSLGGLYVRAFAVYYPEKLAGLVLIDPADFTETQENKRDYYQVLGWNEARIDSMVAALTSNLARRRAGAPPSIQEEGEVLAQLRADDFESIRKHPLPNIPVHILTGGRFDMPQSMRSAAYDEEALFRSKMRHRLARWTEVVQSVDRGMLFYSGDAGHFVHYDDPGLVLASIRLALDDYRALTNGE